MFRLLRAVFARMFGSTVFIGSAAMSLALGFIDFLFSCILRSPSYQPTFENDLFNLSKAVIVIAAVFVSLFFGTENSVVRNKLIVGHNRGNVYCANWVAAFFGVFIINALSMLPYTLAGPLCGAEIGELTVDELLLNVLIEILAVEASGELFFLITVFAERRSICAAGGLVAAILLLYLPKIDDKLRYSPSGQLTILVNKEYTSEIMPLFSLGLISVSTVIGILVFRKKNLR